MSGDVHELAYTFLRDMIRESERGHHPAELVGRAYKMADLYLAEKADRIRQEVADEALAARLQAEWEQEMRGRVTPGERSDGALVTEEERQALDGEWWT